MTTMSPAESAGRACAHVFGALPGAHTCTPAHRRRLPVRFAGGTHLRGRSERRFRRKLLGTALVGSGDIVALPVGTPGAEPGAGTLVLHHHMDHRNHRKYNDELVEQ